MSGRTVEIVPCPPALIADALALALCELTPEQRREVAPHHSGAAVEGLFVALYGGELSGAAWGQRQPGNTAIFWPPQMAQTADRDEAGRLCHAVAAALDAAGVRMTQVLLRGHDAALVPALESAGFEFLADLLYLSWEAAEISGQRPEPQLLEFEPYHESQRKRLLALVERTYALTQDCAAMNGKRPMEEVFDGYQATGVYRPSNWLFVRADEQDVGVLLLADHPAARHCELMYMGVVPELRGRGFGREIVRQAQRLALSAGVERIVLAVDAANAPALAMYDEAGFVTWDQRTVFVRFCRVFSTNAWKLRVTQTSKSRYFPRR